VEFRQLATIRSSITQMILNFPRPEIIDFFFLIRFSHTHTHTHTTSKERKSGSEIKESL